MARGGEEYYYRGVVLMLAVFMPRIVLLLPYMWPAYVLPAFGHVKAGCLVAWLPCCLVALLPGCILSPPLHTMFSRCMNWTL